MMMCQSMVEMYCSLFRKLHTPELSWKTSCHFRAMT
uniref:Uncharacterized protein n=1 Tax=Anguilla anguilla TaxID=7936 RepID=A0A0E9WDD7_ANGAN